MMISKTRVAAFALAMTCGLPVAFAQDDLTQQQVDALIEQQTNALVETALESPEQLEAALEIMEVEQGPAAPESAATPISDEIAGTYILRKKGASTSTTILEVSDGLQITRTVKSGEKVVSRVSGQGQFEDDAVKVDFGKEEIRAEGAARRIGRLFKDGWRKARDVAKVREGVYRFGADGSVKGRFLGAPEKGYRQDLILSPNGTFVLPCATLQIQETDQADRVQITRTDHLGQVLAAEGKKKGSRISVRFPDGSRARYVLRVDNKKVSGSFTPDSAFPGDEEESINDSGWRQGVDPEPTWLSRKWATVKAKVSALKAKTKERLALMVGQIRERVRLMALRGRDASRALINRVEAGIANLAGRIETRAGAIRTRMEARASN